MVANEEKYTNSPIFQSLSQHHSFKELARDTHIGGIDQNAAALFAAQIVSENKKNCLVLCKDPASALSFFDDLKTFLALSNPDQEIANLFLFPGWEISPYSKLNPSIGNRVQRLRCLNKLMKNPNEPKFIISNLMAITQPTIAQEPLIARTLTIHTKEHFSIATISNHLRTLGYIETTLVEDPGTFAIRGGIMDIFSPLEIHPVRLDFWGDEIEKLRFFHTNSQRTFSESSIPTYTIGPLRELETFPEELEKARVNIRNWCDSQNYSRGERDKILTQLADNIVTESMDYLIPFFNEKKSYIWDYFSSNFNTIWIDQKACEQEYQQHIEKLLEGYSSALEKKEICSPPEQLTMPLQLVKKNFTTELCFNPLSILNVNSNNSIKIDIKDSPNFSSGKQGNKGIAKHLQLDNLCKFFREHLDLGYQIICNIPSQHQCDKLLFLLAQNNIPTSSQLIQKSKVNIVPLQLSKGFILNNEKIIFLTEIEIFGFKKIIGKALQNKPKNLSKILQQTSLDNLQIDEYLVHVDHGIGKYRGLIKLSPGGIPGDYVFIEYAGADKLYLPIYRLENIHKYVGGGDASPHLDKLGSQQFEKAKEIARKEVKEIALKLLSIYAKRSSSNGYSFSAPGVEYAEFKERFPYDETPDQNRAIEEVITDMCSSKPMDRLLCGDVGYGKTEVALRAAFLAVNDGKQVAVLVPTTILAEQHLQNFRARFENTPIRIESISRFRSKSEQNEIISKTKSGAVDILIGTHRLFSKDVEFKDLGLLIIDEEQRFGVEHKERLKQLKISTEVLTLTATPIPRTLHLSMIGIRDISIIHTPPADRLAIRTHIAEFDKDTIRSAIENEIQRGGQVFFIHNRVQSLPTIYRTLTEIAPKVRIGVAHGQMPEKELEEVMLGFYQKKFDLLLSTAIIENGLDVPSANTIIVDRADTFGLSQLYQIRGRVGRSQTRAYAYLLLPSDQAITDDAKKRLQILERHIELGSGFAISSHDLELRGAGDILGDAQSGHATEIGYDLYMEMLAEEVASLKGEEQTLHENIEINSSFPAYIPEDYVPDTRSRLSLYKRLSSFETEEEIESSKEELIDRYGTIPPITEELLWLLKAKLLLRGYGFISLKISSQKISLEAGKDPKIDITKLLMLVQKNPAIYSFGSDSKLIIQKNLQSLKETYNIIRDFIHKLDPISD